MNISNRIHAAMHSINPLRHALAASAIRHGTLCAAAFALALFAPGNAQAQNLLLNPSFNGNTTSWTLTGGGAMYEDVAKSHDAIGRCVRMMDPGGTLKQTVTLDAGTYSLSGWFTGGASTAGTCTFQLRDSSNNPVTPSGSSSPTLAAYPTWANWAREYTGLSAGNYTVYVYCNTGWVVADDFSLTVKTGPNTACDLAGFSWGSYVGIINQTAQTVSLVVPYFTDLTTLAPTCAASIGATISPTGEQNFSDSVATPVQYTVTAEAGGSNQKTYAITVTHYSTILLNGSFYGNAANWTLTNTMYEDNDGIPAIGEDSFHRCIRMGNNNGTLTQTVILAAGDYTLTGWFTVNGSGRSANFELRDSTNATVTPSAFSSPTMPTQPSWVQWQRDYTNLVAGTYTVYVKCITQAVWADNFSLTVKAPVLSTACDLTGFAWGSYVGAVNQSTQTVSLVVPYYTDLTTMVPTCAASLHATTSPTGAQDFSGSVTTPVQYTVTAEDGVTKKDYLVTVTKYSTILLNGGLNTTANWTLAGGGILYEDVQRSQDAIGRCVRMMDPGGTLKQTVTLAAGNYTLSGWLAGAPAGVSTIGTSTFQLRDSGNIVVAPASSASQSLAAYPTWANWTRNYVNLLAGDYTVYVYCNSGWVEADNFSIVPRGAFGTECDMVSFDWGTSIGVITPGSPNTVSLTVPVGTDLATLNPTVGVSAYATFAPAGAQDFTNSATTPVPYTVTAEDGLASKVYQVTVTLEASYGAWAAANGASSNPLEDSNHNGVPNGVEYFMGGTLASPATLPPLADNAGTWTWTIPYDPTAAATYLFQVSGDLSGWSDVLSGDIAVLTGPDQLRLTLPSGMRFCRLLVTTP